MQLSLVSNRFKCTIVRLQWYAGCPCSCCCSRTTAATDDRFSCLLLLLLGSFMRLGHCGCCCGCRCTWFFLEYQLLDTIRIAIADELRCWCLLTPRGVVHHTATVL